MHQNSFQTHGEYIKSGEDQDNGCEGEDKTAKGVAAQEIRNGQA